MQTQKKLVKFRVQENTEPKTISIQNNKHYEQKKDFNDVKRLYIKVFKNKKR